LLSNGADATLLKSLRKAIEAEEAEMAVVCQKIGGVVLADKTKLPADHSLSAAPSGIFDAVALITSDQGAKGLAEEAVAIDWVRDAFGHLKIVGFNGPSLELLNK